MITDNRDELEEYGAKLVAAGFQVWLVLTYPRHGFLRYRSPEGWWGTLQEDTWGGLEHSMPIVPSRENGSSMYLEPPQPDPLTVEAAKACAREFNRNAVVGRQRNAGHVYEKRHAPHSLGTPLHATPAPTGGDNG